MTTFWDEDIGSSAGALAADDRGRNRSRVLHPLLCCLVAMTVAASTHRASLAQVSFSQPTTSTASAPTTEPVASQATVELNFQGRVQLDAFLSYVSRRIGTRFEYTTEIGDRQIVLRAPGEIPVQSLPALLASVLRTESLVLVDSDIPGWKRVIDVGQMPQFAPTGKAPEVLARNGPAAPVTEVFVLENASSTALATVLKPFLSDAGGNLLSVPESNVLIVTDYASVVTTLADLIRLIDQPGESSSYQMYEVRNQEAASLAEQVRGILEQRSGATTAEISLVEHPQSNRVVVIGRAALVDEAILLLQRLDVSLGMTTEVYRIKHTTAERVDKLAKGFLQPQDADRIYQSTIDEDGNLLVIRATNEVHRQIAKLIAELDTPIESSESPIQFYKLRNASAIDVLYTLLALQDAYGGGAFTGGLGPGLYSPLGGYGVPAYGGLPLGASLFGAGMGLGAQMGGLQSVPLPLTPRSNGVTGDDSFMPQRNNPLARPTLANGTQSELTGETGNNLPMSGAPGMGSMLAAGGVAVLPGGARVSADISTNSLIVVAPANVQDMYAELIRSLDQRRPQVLIEAKIIAVDTSDEFSLGVEVSLGDREGDKRLFKFTSFGLSEVNPETGALQIIPGLGFNGTLVNPDVADVVVRALSSHQRARVLAAPKILVNDNSTGKLESVSSVPFSSVNASQTVSTTSLGGDQQAGTVITVTPHINEDDHLQLDFDVEFSTFSGNPIELFNQDGNVVGQLPPARQIDRVGSSVTIPDGKTVVVGGLKRVGENDSFVGVPWAEKIPIVRELTSRTDRNSQTTSFFLFIRPIILRDSRFSDLRFLSERQAGEMCLPGDYPVSHPELIP